MDLTRRHFASLCAGLGVAPLASLVSASGVPAFLSAYRDPEGAYGVAALGDTGDLLFTEALPARGHDTVISPDQRTAITFARRPGRFAVVIDLRQQRPSFAFESATNRHFYGHGFFSPDGALLYATENDYNAERGVLGIYDVAAGFARVDEMETHGIGPHEALLLADGRTIAVANGGILTHPDFPRQKLNLASMEPSLVYMDAQTGHLLEKVMLPRRFAQLSIRHMDQAGDGAVWFGGQYEGARTHELSLIGRHQQGQDIELIDLPGNAMRDLQHYVGSVKTTADGMRVAVTSPRGNQALIIDCNTRTLIDVIALPDVCGVASARAGFTMSTGRGLLGEAEHPFRWDNHLRGLAL